MDFFLNKFRTNTKRFYFALPVITELCDCSIMATAITLKCLLNGVLGLSVTSNECKFINGDGG